ncbi:DUF3857 domain-containing protein [Pontimicrobium sp. SW4]|uniref:DUF3857 domain-containing protein n=1 Tax=Pontimicrobium sp. SW4 TaxID=3153519 RepID=A0AAU7BQI4_9FLAO
MIKKISLITLLISISFLSAQEMEFGEVTKEELLETKCPIDSSANAMVIYKYRNTYFDVNISGGGQTVTEIYQKIKIYNKEGFENATRQIRLFESKSAREVLSKLKAVTYNLEGDKIVETKLEKNQIFENEQSYNITETKFTMPKVKEGSVIEFKYRVTSPFYWAIDEFRFQSHIPIKKIEARIKTPKSFVFKPTFKGYISFYPKRESYIGSGLGGESMVVDVYNLDNVPALKEELYVDNIDNYTAGVNYELASVEVSLGVTRDFAKTWGDVAKSIGSSDDYKKELDKTRTFDEILDPILADASSKEEKMKLIFKYVKDNIKWNGRDGIYFQKGIKKSLKEKEGNAGDINLALVAMLRYADIDANPLVISTKDNQIPYFPTLEKLNYVVAYAEINEKKYFLDATQEFSDINLLPLRDYNWDGIFIDNPNKIWKKVSLLSPKQAITQYQIDAKLAEDGVVEGDFKSRLFGHQAYLFREEIKDQDMDAFITSREDDFNDIEISDYETKNTDTYEGNVNESFSFYQENGAEVLSDKIYFQPLMFMRMTENPFKLDKREYPIDFGFPFKDMYIINVDIPEGYELESDLTPFMVRSPDGNIEFKYTVSVMNNKLRLSAIFDIKEAKHAAETYLILKEIFNQAISKQAEQIVFKKI